MKRNLINVSALRSQSVFTSLLFLLPQILIFLFAQLVCLNPSFAADSLYVDDQTCASCHQNEYQQWHHSHHALAMQNADSQSVLANFNQSVFTYGIIKTTFFIRNKHYYINTVGPDGKYTNYTVKYTFGVDPLQQYLVVVPDGKLQAFPIAWDTQHKKWFHLNPAENMKNGDTLYWGNRYYNWNFSCADCHSTHLNKNYSAATNSYRTTWSAINVGCQACHGPGKNHIAWAKHLASTFTTKAATIAPNGTTSITKNNSTSITNDGLLIHFKSMNNTQFVETCAFCHSRRHPIVAVPQNGTALLDNYIPEILRANIYYADGSIEDEDYEYGSFIQSKMYKSGVICTDCHNPHTALIKVNNNSLCTQCHNSQPQLQRFPTLIAKNYDTPTHTHHPLNSIGSACISCHMPTKTYMNIDVRRDHYFRIPRPALTVKYGIPNACNNCHRDKTPKWAEQTIEKWYGKNRVNMVNQGADYVDAIVQGRLRQPEAQQQLIQLANDNSQSSIVRATVAYLLHDYHSEDSQQTLINLTKNADPLVRMNAIDSLETIPPDQKIVILLPMLNDPIRAVRIEAAKVLAAVRPQLLSVDQTNLFNKVCNEYKDSQQAVIDTSEANLNLAELAEAQNDKSLAEKYYLRALQLNPNFFPANQNLAMLYNSEGQNDKAEIILKQGISHHPNQGELYYSLGLLLAEENQLDKSAVALNTATQLMPTFAKGFYNYGLILQHLNKYPEAETALLKSIKLNPAEPNTLYALAILYGQMQQWDKVQHFAIILRDNFPDSLQAQQLMQAVNARSSTN